MGLNAWGCMAGRTTPAGSLVTRVGPHTVHGYFCGFCFRAYVESSYCLVAPVGSVSSPMWNPLTLSMVTLILSMFGILLHCPWLESAVHGYPYIVHVWNPLTLSMLGILLLPLLPMVTPVGSVSGPVTEAKTEATLRWPCQQILAPR